MGKLFVMAKVFMNEFGDLSHQETPEIRFKISSGVMIVPSTLLRVRTLATPRLTRFTSLESCPIFISGTSRVFEV
jgi:hypothetical protein